jgi:non-specific protein-tyrosine kinase
MKARKQGMESKAGTKTTEQEMAGQRVSPAYSRTRVDGVDPGWLMKNKIVALFPEMVLTDQINLLRSQVLNQMEEIGGNSLLVTSPNPGEGKTWTAINLAVSMSHKLDQTVLLMDANLRSPAVHLRLGLDCRRGLSDYLLREAEIPDLLINPGIEKLVVLPGGRPLIHSVEFLGSQRMEGLVKEMKERYTDRFIIIDGAPVLSSADSLLLSRFVDAVLLIVSSEQTQAKSVIRAMELLAGRKVIGAVLNKCRE